MMDYDKIYERVVRRGDAILEQRRKKAVKIRQTSYAFSSVCAAVITGVGIWHMTNLKKLPDNRLSKIETVEDITTTNTDITATVTEKPLTYTETSKKTTTSKTTSSTSAVTSESRTSALKSTTTSEASSSDTSSASENVNTTVSNVTETQTEKVNETTALQTQITETSSGTTTRYTETSAEIPTTNLAKYSTTTAENQSSIVHVESPEITHDPSVFNIIEFPDADTESTDYESKPRKYRYTGDKIDGDMISSLKNKVLLKKQQYPYRDESEIETTAYIYKLRSYSYYAVIAVRFEDDYNYYKYIATSFTPDNLSELISAFYLTADSLSDECKYWSSIIPDINKTETWKMLTSDISLSNISKYCEDHKISLYPDLKFTFGSSRDSWFKGTIGIDSQGYMIIKVDNITDAVFFIGEDKAEEIISNINVNHS